MKTAFADTFYFLALLDSREKRHHAAIAASRDTALRIMTTEWILVEFGDAYCDPKDRPDFIAVYRSLMVHPRVKIVCSSAQLFERGVEFFDKRADKKWSLTDCLSFVVMQEEGIREALTGDRDFEQAGFVALFK